MQIAEFSQDEITVAEARGRIDTESSKEFGNRIAAIMVKGADRLLVDMSHIAYVSSAGFRTLLEIGRQSQACSCQFGLCALNSEVMRLFEISGFADLFRIFSNRDEGIAGLSKL